MMHSRSRQRITLLEERVMLLEAELSETVDHLIETRKSLLVHLGWSGPTSGLMFSSNADTGPGSGDGTPISGRETGADISGAMYARQKSHSRETGNDDR